MCSVCFFLWQAEHVACNPHMFKSRQSVLVRHSTRGILHPTVDRYSAIRRFFLHQLVSAPQPRSITAINAGIRRNNGTLTVRFNHTDVKQKTTSPHPNTPPDKPLGVDQKPAEPHSHLPPLNLDNYPRLYRRLALSLSHLHRPTRDDFLKVANGFWQRLRIRFKWFTIRSFRRFNADDISAFVTWFLMSQTLWVLVGT